MLFEIQTIAPAWSNWLADSVSGPPVISESISKPVATIALSPSTATSAIPTTRNSRDRRVIEPGSATIKVTSSTPSRRGSTRLAQAGGRPVVAG